MIVFWLLAAALIALALLFVWLPLRRAPANSNTPLSNEAPAGNLVLRAYHTRLAELDAELAAGGLGPEEYQALRLELERSLLSETETSMPTPVASTANIAASRWPALLLSLAISSGALGLYLKLGSSGELAGMAYREQLQEQLLQADALQRMSLLRLAWREQPEDIEIGYALANEYMRQEMFTEARGAYARLLELTEDNAAIMAEYAQALFLMQDQRITPEIDALTREVLALQPNNVTALSLMGIGAFQQQRFQTAISYWQQVLELRPQGAGAEAMRAGIARARAELAQSGVAPADEATAGAGAELVVVVELSPSLQAEVAPEDTVFVFARAVDGPPMPLAVVRLLVKDLPAEVTLSDAMAMMPAARLSSVDEVELIARISKAGTPAAQPGDLEGSYGPVAVAGSGEQETIKITIDRVITGNQVVE